MRSLLVATLALAPALRAQPAAGPESSSPPPASAGWPASDPFAGRLVLTPTAQAHPAGTGHVSLRSAAYAIVPAMVGVQASLGLTDEIGLGTSLVQTIGRSPFLVATAKWTPAARGPFSAAFGATVVSGGAERSDFRRPSGPTVDPFVVATIAAAPDASAVTAMLGARAWSVGANLRTGVRTRLLLELARPAPSLDRYSDGAPSPSVVSAAVRSYGPRHAVELGVTLVPSELNACAGSEALLCLPPVFPSFAWGRRLRF